MEYSLKKGFDKFGTRKKLMSDDSGILNQSKELIMGYEKAVYDIFKKNRWENGTLFFEFHGPNSLQVSIMKQILSKYHLSTLTLVELVTYHRKNTSKHLMVP